MAAVLLFTLGAVLFFGGLFAVHPLLAAAGLGLFLMIGAVQIPDKNPEES